MRDFSIWVGRRGRHAEKAVCDELWWEQVGSTEEGQSVMCSITFAFVWCLSDLVCKTRKLFSWLLTSCSFKYVASRMPVVGPLSSCPCNVKAFFRNTVVPSHLLRSYEALKWKTNKLHITHDLTQHCVPEYIMGRLHVWKPLMNSYQKFCVLNAKLLNTNLCQNVMCLSISNLTDNLMAPVITISSCWYKRLAFGPARSFSEGEFVFIRPEL